MRRHLCISVTFLDRTFHGRGDVEAEWPPSPLRVFQALVAGARAGCRANDWFEETARAFQWLESREPPEIIAPKASKGAARTFYVPNNDGDEKADRQERLTAKVAEPHWLRDGLTVHYVWALDGAGEGSAGGAHVRVLCREARHLLALGWGIDQAVGTGRIVGQRELEALPGRRWRPWRIHRAGTRTWRSPVQGTLEELEAVHQEFTGRIQGKVYVPQRKTVRFEMVQYLSSARLPPRPFAAFELSEGAGFRPEKAVVAAAMVRSLACEHAKGDSHKFPGGAEIYVAGHLGNGKEGAARFSYLPLPTIGHEHADGLIRRVVIAEPFGGSGRHASWAQTRLRNCVLRDCEGNERGMLLDLWRPASKMMIERYAGEHQQWLTVTPVVLPGFDDGKHAKAEKLLLKALLQGGIPGEAIETMALRKAPFWPGAQYASRYFAPDYLRGFSRWHAAIRFREQIPGPMAVGAGRHVGLGLFAGID